MSRILLGVLCGLGFGILVVFILLPQKNDNKREKLEGIISAFIERFMIGFIIPNFNIGINPIITGGIIGLGLSLPDSIVTRSYIPINAVGIIGGLIIGIIVNFVK
jgi:hypothetical protein